MNSSTMRIGGLEQCTNKKSKTETLTRSSARHLRRKRMKDARKHESEEPEFLEGNCSISRDNIDNILLEKTVVTKSKARRLRKKKRADEEDDGEQQQDLSKQSNSNNITCIPASRDLQIFSPDKPYQDEAEGQESEGEDVDREEEDSQNYNVSGLENRRNLPQVQKLMDLFLSQKSPENAFVKFEEYLNQELCRPWFQDNPCLHTSDATLEVLAMLYQGKLERESHIDYFKIVERAVELERASRMANRMASASASVGPAMDSDESSTTKKEDIKAERKARKAEKAVAKAKAKATKTGQSKGKANEKEKTVTTTDTVKEVESTRMIEVTETSVTTDIPDAVDAAKSTVPPAEESGTSEGKSKAQLRAERRAKQEAQRAAKQKKQQETIQETQPKSVKNREVTSNKSSTGDRTSSRPKETSNSLNAATTGTLLLPEATLTLRKKDTPKKVITAANNKDAHEANLFKHLYNERELAFIVAPSVKNKIHPGIVRLGVQYANKTIVGSNARCVALLAAVKQLLRDFERPSQADFIRSLESTLQESVAYLHHCRPTAVSMQNALRHLKWQMTQLPSTISDTDAKTKLESAIDTYILEQIQLAGKAISITIQRKISNGDVILTYGYSSLINKILLDAHAAGKKFRVIVVDGRPWLEGREQLRRLAKNGVECFYILINALSFVMPEVSKVFLGAHAILANGAVMSRVGTAQVALMARAFNVPVLVACETHKSCERVQTDSIVYNELGNPDDLADFTAHGSPTRKAVLANWKNKRSLNLLNITYDVTPADLVTAVVTELAILPCTSVPVILRIKPSEI